MRRPAPELDDTDRRILNALQEGLPLTSRPYAQAASRLGLSEADLITRLARLRESGVITRFGPFYDAAALGGAFCLCAMEVPAERFEAVAAIVNGYPEVAHNYQREHRFNMWFVLATETAEAVEAVADEIEAETGLAVLRFPKLREFFIGFKVAA